MEKQKIKVGYSVINSLLFFYFGFDLMDSKDTILDRLINRAYRDATIQGAFNTLLQDEDLKEKAKSKKVYAIKLLKESLCNIGNNRDFNDWHQKTCRKIKKLYDDSLNIGITERFTYGNAQKFVNMAVKYLYMLGEIDYEFDEEMNKILKCIKSNEKVIHIPIDSFIIDAIWKNTDVQLDKYVKVKNMKNDKEYARPSDYVQGWSSWNDKQYYNIEEDLVSFLRRKNINPMEWEMYEWINISKYRNKLDK